MKRFAVIATLVYLAFVAMLTLGPQPSNGLTMRISLDIVAVVDRFVSGAFSYSDLEFCANIGMFVPVGFLLLLLLGRRRWWLAALACGALTVLIETAQLGIPSRVSDPRDLIANSIGALIGILVALPLAGPARVRRAA